MKLVSFGPPGQEKSGVIAGNSIVDLHAADPSLPKTVRGILSEEKLDLVSRIESDAASVSDEYKHPIGSVRLGPPVIDPSSGQLATDQCSV